MSVGTTCTGQHHARLDWRADDVIGFGGPDVFLGQGCHFAEGEREVEGSVIHGAEICVGARRLGRLVGNDREVDLL
jgi:hypothetical protein